MKQTMVGDVPGKVLGMLTDLGHKLQHGAITPEQLAEFLKKNETNQFGGGEALGCY